MAKIKSLFNDSNIFIRQFTVRIFFTYSMPLFINHIFYIIQMSAKKKMSWVYTKSIITIMQYIKPIWNFTISEFPRNSVRTKLTLFVFNPQLSISATSPLCLPDPTFIKACYFNLIPERTDGRAKRLMYLWFGFKGFLAILTSSDRIIVSHFLTSFKNLVGGLRHLECLSPYFI